jgi:hypothetical protein
VVLVWPQAVALLVTVTVLTSPSEVRPLTIAVSVFWLKPAEVESVWVMPPTVMLTLPATGFVTVTTTVAE